MGVDAELYIWGPFVSDADLQVKEARLVAEVGHPLGKEKYHNLERCEWWEDQHGMHLLEMSLNGARFFDVGWDRFTGWGSAMRRIRLAQELFPEHFLVYTNDSTYMERIDGHEALTEERILEIDADWWARADEDFKRWRRRRGW